jgi:hypothetical protein
MISIMSLPPRTIAQQAVPQKRAEATRKIPIQM